MDFMDAHAKGTFMSFVLGFPAEQVTYLLRLTNECTAVFLVLKICPMKHLA